MALNINSLTEESIKTNPWLAIEAVVYNNPEELALAISHYTGSDVPNEPAALFSWLKQYYQENGNLEILQVAANQVPILGATAKSFDWGGLLGGLVQGALGTLGIGKGSSNSNDKLLEAMALQQAQARQTTTTILIVLGVAVVGIIAFVAIKK